MKSKIRTDPFIIIALCEERRCKETLKCNLKMSREENRRSKFSSQVSVCRAKTFMPILMENGTVRGRI